MGGGHPQGPPDQRAQHVRLRHEGQVHQAHPQEGLQVREQVCQAPRKGSQVRVREPAQSQGQVEVLSLLHPTPTIHTHQNILLAQCIYIKIIKNQKLSSPFVGSLHTADPHFSKQQQQDPRARTPNIILRMRKQD